MTLSEFISEAGDDAAASLFNVSERTAASWRRGERSPRTEKAREIEQATDGRVTFSECFERPSVAAA